MELSPTYQYTNYSQQKSLVQTKGNENNSAEKATVNYQSARYTSFRLTVQLMSKSEVSSQNTTFDFSIDSQKLEINLGQPGTESSSLSLFDEDGYWGIEQTSDRMAGFVVNGAGDNLERLRMGREGIIKGFKEAEQIWGGQLPDISYKTQEQALAKIDERIRSFGAPVVDIAA